MEKLVLKEKTTIMSGEKARRLAGLLEEGADVFEIIGFLEAPEAITSAIAEDIFLVQDAPNAFERYLDIFQKYLNIKW